MLDEDPAKRKVWSVMVDDALHGAVYQVWDLPCVSVAIEVVI